MKLMLHQLELCWDQSCPPGQLKTLAEDLRVLAQKHRLAAVLWWHLEVICWVAWQEAPAAAAEAGQGTSTQMGCAIYPNRLRVHAQSGLNPAWPSVWDSIPAGFQQDSGLHPDF